MRPYFLGVFCFSITLLSCDQQKESNNKISVEVSAPTKITEKDISKLLSYNC